MHKNVIGLTELLFVRHSSVTHNLYNIEALREFILAGYHIASSSLHICLCSNKGRWEDTATTAADVGSNMYFVG